MRDLIDRQAAIDVLKMDTTIIPYEKARQYVDIAIEAISEGLKKLPSAQPSFSQRQENDCVSRKSVIKALRSMRKESDSIYVTSALLNLEAIVQDLLPTEPDTWMEQNRERILQAGMEGREVEFRIGGRLFAIREKAQ